MTEQKRPTKKAPYIAAIGVTAVILIVLFIMYDDTPSPYLDGQRTPQQVINDISHINNTIELECSDQGLNDPEWTCPKVSQDQTILIIARLITNYVEYNDATVLGKHYSEETINELKTALHRTVQRLRDGKCVPHAQINLQPTIITKLEQGEFTQQCGNGWSLTKPWHEVISRQSPPPTPDWAFYQRHLPAELLP